MKNILFIISCLLCTFIFTGCATITSKTQTVTVTSDVDGANVYHGSKYIGKTPLQFDTKKAKLSFTLTKDGYENQKILIDRKFRGNMWLGYFFGIGPLVDLCTGQAYKFKQTDYFVSMKDPSINLAHNERINKKYAWVNTVAAISSVALTGVAAYAGAKQAENSKKAAEEKAKAQQKQAQMEAHWAEQRAQARANETAKKQEELARVYGGSSSLSAQMNAEKNKSQTRNMGTSDLAQYNATRMSDATYGTAATNQALAQQRQYNAQQNQQAQIHQQQINQQQRQQVAQQQQILGAAVNAVTASGAHVQIKVNGNQVTGYSSGNNMMGPEWKAVVPVAYVQETSAPTSQASSNIASVYAYQASVNGLGMVYWGTPTRRVINDAPSGNPVKAVTQNGQTLTIMVNGNNVVAYGSGLNQASDIQWHNILPSANIAETNNSIDGDLASRFKHKASIPGIGTVYF